MFASPRFVALIMSVAAPLAGRFVGIVFESSFHAGAEGSGPAALARDPPSAPAMTRPRNVFLEVPAAIPPGSFCSSLGDCDLPWTHSVSWRDFRTQPAFAWTSLHTLSMLSPAQSGRRRSF